ncbi:MAG TPA: peptidoglycan DD-metalloendopeptidase family protein [Candidatus Paceibacterota bacterium]|nr:peptidoglycan DD-metalloendopeptidase family protein [Candidatus Paceibacterota bacterium]
MLRIFPLFTYAVFIALFALTPLAVFAQDAATLRAQIDAKNREIAALEKEIAAFQTQINQTQNAAKTLQNAIRALDLTRQKLSADISVTQKKIDATTLTILSLGDQIVDKETSIGRQEAGLGEALRNLYEHDRTSTAAALLAHESLGDFWADQEDILIVNQEMRERVKDLTALRDTLAENKRSTEAEKAKLTDYQRQLQDQRALAEANKREKDKLLRETKNNEATYKALLAEKSAKRDAFLREISNYEAQLRLIIDPSSYPKAGKGILGWPLSNVSITQYFGNTEFAQSGAYNGKGHNGIDLRASVGTKVFSAGSGIVKATGNTDNKAGCYSYGQWVMIDHPNGLTTLYSHLSLINVSEGQTVARGSLIGYAGATGYATGPHLHFSVFATQGVRVVTYNPSSATNCRGVKMPVADLRAYLNPLSYL